MNASEVQRWIAYPRSDLDAAYTLLEKGEFFPRQICFMSQQAGEKALKAVLVYLGISFPKIHDLDPIREPIPEGWRVKEKFPQLYALSIWVCRGAVSRSYTGSDRRRKLKKSFSWQRRWLYGIHTIVGADTKI